MLFRSPDAQAGLDTVSFDNVAAGRLAVEYLAGLGHERIGYIGSCREPANIDATARQSGYLEALSKLGLKSQPEWIFDRTQITSPIAKDDAVCQLEGHYAARHLLKLGPSGPTAWIAYSDLVAVHLMRQLSESGVRVPGDVSVVGVDDSEWARFMTPTLTSVRHPLEEMGRQAASVLIERSEASDSSAGKPQHVVFPPEMVIRESTAAPPQTSR